MPRGGKRVGSGRPRGNRIYPVTVRISADSYAYLSKKDNISEFIDRLILDAECREILLGKPF